MAGELNPITHGSDHHFFRKLEGLNAADFPTEAQVAINFKGPRTIRISNEGDGAFDLSFNGNTLHADSTPGEASEDLIYHGVSYVKLWFRTPSGATDIRIESWRQF